MQLTCYGAAREVTGSKHLLDIDGKRILLDFGMFQGRRKEADAKNRALDINPESLDAVILSHAHIDHSGLLPLLVREGYRGRIYCTPPTRDLCAVMLQDSANIQERDAKWLSRKKHEFIPPLYTVEDAVLLMDHVVCVPYREPFELKGGIRFTFHDAGHVLGSAMVLVEWTEDGVDRSFLFSGDIGRRNLPILRDPDIPKKGDWVLMEGTYGNREHQNVESMEHDLERIVNETAARGGKVIIPSFALERAQEVVYTLKRLEMRGAIPELPVFVDSPLAVDLTEVFRLHVEYFDAEIRDDMARGGDPFRLRNIRYIRDAEESIALNDRTDPMIIISASGMCEFGRVVHHIKNNCGDPKNTILIVGFQAQHTLGRRIIEKRPYLKIFGVDYPLKARVEAINAFSCHAGRTELLNFARGFRGTAREIFLVHGEDDALEALRDELAAEGQAVTIAQPGAPIRLA